YEFSALYPTPPGSSVPLFMGLDAGERVSLRGNVLIGCNIPPYSYADNFGDRLVNLTNISAPFMSTNGSVIPSLSTNSTAGDIIGSCASSNGGIYTNITIDVYVLDPEGWNNGKLFNFYELTDNSTYSNGFPQGKTYLGSFVDNGPYDRDPAVGSFNFNAAALNLTAGTDITITSNYSADPPGTHNSPTHTSNFSNATQLRTPLKITAITRSGTTWTSSWSGGSPNYTLQKKSPINGTWNIVPTGITGTSTTDTISGTEAYYRVLGN